MFHALADATRRDILRVAATGEHSVSSLARRYTTSFAAVQKHVAVLAEVGLVRKTRVGREQRVTTDVDRVRTARAVLDEGRIGTITSAGEPEKPARNEDDGSRALIRPAATTLMASPNMQTWVTGARTVEVRGDELVVFDIQNRETGVLVRDTESPAE